METNGFNVITGSQLGEINGGGFAYDMGRFLRFYGIYVTEGMAAALGDWWATDAVSSVMSDGS